MKGCDTTNVSVIQDGISPVQGLLCLIYHISVVLLYDRYHISCVSLYWIFTCWNKVSLYHQSHCDRQEPRLWTQRCVAAINSQWWWRTWPARQTLSSPLVLLLSRWPETLGLPLIRCVCRRTSRARIPSPSPRWGSRTSLASIHSETLQHKCNTAQFEPLLLVRFAMNHKKTTCRKCWLYC